MPRTLRRPWRALITALVGLLALLVARYAGVPLPYGDVVGGAFVALVLLVPARVGTVLS